MAGEAPVTFVRLMVVSGAQPGEVGEIGGAAVLPGLEVVGVAPGGGRGAVRPLAGAGAGEHGAALGGGGEPAGPADVEGLAGATEHDGDQVGLAGEAASSVGRQRGAVGELAVATFVQAVGEGVGIEEDGDRGPDAVALGDP
jgi:hypothetical protein